MKIMLVLFFCFLPLLLFGQDLKSCCEISGPAQFALLGTDPAFRMSHAEPHPFHFTAEKGIWITFKTGGKDARAFEVKADKPTPNIVFVFHEWWGFNDYIQQEAEQIQKALGSAKVIALDLYDGKVATTREEAGALMGEMTTRRGKEIIDGALDYVGHDARILTIGWCFGGGWSLQGAIEAGPQGVGCVMYYGMPESDTSRLKMLQAPVLGIFAKKDGWINDKVVSAFEKNMKDGQKKLVVRWYDAVHAFANPSNPDYDKVATEDAWQHAVAFFKEHLH